MIAIGGAIGGEGASSNGKISQCANGIINEHIVMGVTRNIDISECRCTNQGREFYPFIGGRVPIVGDICMCESKVIHICAINTVVATVDDKHIAQRDIADVVQEYAITN